MDPLDQPATPQRLHALAAAGLLGPAELERARTLAGHLPTPRNWIRFANVALLLAGAALILAGIIYFFACNWADLHRFAKFALIQLAILATGGYALWRRLEPIDAQAALFAACILLGALLAVYGQVYQTGADAYTLFLTWAALILVPTLLARNAPLWMLLITLLHLALRSAWDQRIAEHYAWLDVAHFALAGVALAGWELARARGAAWMRPPWYSRALLVLAAFFGIGLIFRAIESGWYLRSGDLVFAIAPIAALLLGLVAAHHFRRVAPDLPALSLIALCAIAIVTRQVSNWVGWDSTFGVLFVGVLVLAQVAAASGLLLREARAMGVLR